MSATNHGQEYVEQWVAWQAFFSNKESEVPCALTWHVEWDYEKDWQH